MFSKSFVEDLQPLHLLKHPFYQAWMAGSLTRAQLQNYAVQYFPHVEAFPRYVSAVHSQCEDAQAQADLAHNLADEEAVQGGKPHPELWLDFAESLGVERSQVAKISTQAAAKKLKDGYFELARSSYAAGLGALAAYEYQVPEIATSKIEGLQKNYGLSSEAALKFFQVHEKADIYHSEACLRAMDRLSVSEAAEARRAGKVAAQLLWDFLSEAYAQT